MKSGKVEVKEEMSVRAAGKKGGNTTKKRYGHDYYVAIGRKGGSKVRELINAGKKAVEDAQA